MAVTLPEPSPFFAHWGLDPSICFLNHGSFGATPRAVLAAQDRIRGQMESEPVRFFVQEMHGLMDEARRALSEFVHCPWDCIAPMPNATNAVATVMQSLVDAGMLSPGDEILTNEHEYTACQNTLKRTAKRSGAVIKSVALPFPVAHPSEITSAVMSGVSERTRVVMMSHVTSPSGLVMPVAEIVRELNARGIISLIDGAHAPGMVPDLNINQLNPTFYTANCHKWICSPKGSAFLYVQPDLRSIVRPLALSNNAEKPRTGRDLFLTEFDYQGTSDYSAFMAIPAAIRFMGSLLPGGWPAVMEHNHNMVIRGRNIICEALSITPPAPDSMIGSISTMILPERMGTTPQRPTMYHDATQDDILHRYRVQAPLWGIPTSPRRFMRISAQVYNSVEQYEYYAAALCEMAGEMQPAT
jgi:isopenicillin-N epimerase